MAEDAIPKGWIELPGEVDDLGPTMTLLCISQIVAVRRLAMGSEAYNMGFRTAINCQYQAVYITTEDYKAVRAKVFKAIWGE